ncbi:MAG: putative manganese-dependent inorganic diphosphatase [Firmicutes bacterium]|nr:putative manganese-dependent inorganic diphosphatase [Bacillota bacterium]
MSDYIFGHKNPDTDSITSAIALSNLKNKLGHDTLACRLGDINKETKYVLNHFKVDKPIFIENVKTQIKDLNYDEVMSIDPKHSILYAYKLMEEKKIRTLPIVKDNKLIGIVTMKDIAMGLINGNYYNLKTGLTDMASDLKGKVLVKSEDEIEGRIYVISYFYKTIKKDKFLDENSIIIVGDRYDIIKHAIDSKVKLIIITGDNDLPEKYLKKAEKNNVNIISVNMDTYTTSKLINQCNYISSIMKDTNIVKFYEGEYLDDIREKIITNKHSYYPVVTKDNKYLGFMSRRHMLKPNKKKVYLVDHNEYTQSALGLEEAEILEIIDHHKLGDIKTDTPINFRNNPVGSTCTILYNMYRELNIDIDYRIAGLLISGIISDTLLLKSPTTTLYDKNAVNELNKILNLDIEKYAMDMFKAGTSLEGQSIDEIFYKDFKEFNINGNKIGIGQVFTLDIEDVFNRKEKFIEFIKKIQQDKDYEITLLLITDIMKEGSYLIYKCVREGIMETAFNKEAMQGMFVEGVVSRKKQVIPRISDALKILK